MGTLNFKELAKQYKTELFDNIIPFWIDNSIDEKYGGYFTCLDRQGNVFDTDKFVWLQCREVWLFSMLYNNVEKKQEWLDVAIQGAEFLKKYGHDGEYNWYFSLTRDGNPIIQPYNIFSYTFASMAFGQLSKATGNDEYANISLCTFNKIISKADKPKGRWDKSYLGTRNLKGFALPMILCNLSLEIEHLLDKSVLDSTINTCVDEVMNKFYRKDLGIIVENINEDCSLSDTFEGRLVNPGHAIEAMWFIMDLGVRLNRKDLVNDASMISIQMLEYGWDKKYGGVFYFMDRKGYPTQQLEWDQKLWWVHIESLITTLKSYQLTKSDASLEWFKKLHDYTWSNFKDKDFSEWYGYLNRRAEVLLPLKGGKWKGCFHVPRGLYQCWKTLDAISSESI